MKTNKHVFVLSDQCRSLYLISLLIVEFLFVHGIQQRGIVIFGRQQIFAQHQQRRVIVIVTVGHTQLILSLDRQRRRGSAGLRSFDEIFVLPCLTFEKRHEETSDADENHSEEGEDTEKKKKPIGLIEGEPMCRLCLMILKIGKSIVQM